MFSVFFFLLSFTWNSVSSFRTLNTFQNSNGIVIRCSCDSAVPNYGRHFLNANGSSLSTKPLEFARSAQDHQLFVFVNRQCNFSRNLVHTLKVRDEPTGICTFLEKPFAENELTLRLRKILGLSDVDFHDVEAIIPGSPVIHTFDPLDYLLQHQRLFSLAMQHSSGILRCSSIGTVSHGEPELLPKGFKTDHDHALLAALHWQRFGFTHHQNLLNTAQVANVNSVIRQTLWQSQGTETVEEIRSSAKMHTNNCLPTFFASMENCLGSVFGRQFEIVDWAVLAAHGATDASENDHPVVVGNSDRFTENSLSSQDTLVLLFFPSLMWSPGDSGSFRIHYSVDRKTNFSVDIPPFGNQLLIIDPKRTSLSALGGFNEAAAFLMCAKPKL